MAENYYDATGVLVLDRVTPVITALFSGLNLDATHPGGSQVYIALTSEGSGALWDNITEELAELATSLGLTLPADEIPPIQEVLELLARHFGADQDEALSSMIEQHQFKDSADLDALFLIATRFNDGHNLSEICFEGCWHCSKARLFEFGGEGYFLSREFEAFSSSRQALQLGQEICNALLSNELDKAAEVIAREAHRLLAGLNDEAQRADVQQRVATLLQATPSVESTAR